MKVNKERFFELLPRLDVIPFTQSKGWHDFRISGTEEYWVDSDPDVNIGCWSLSTNHKGLGKKLIIEGLAHKAATPSKIKIKFLRDLINDSGADYIELSDLTIQDAEHEVALRRSGLIRPLALHLCPMSIVVDCQNGFKFHRNWKRQVKKSLDCNNSFSVLTNPTENELQDFLNLFEQLKKRKSLGYSLSVESLKKLTDSPEYFLSFIHNSDGKPLCARITYVHRGHAYDIFAANSDEGLTSGAIYHNQQALLEYLHDSGVSDFDYGRIPPGTDEMDNIYISKSHSGGNPVIYSGEWQFAKSNFKNWLYNFYRYGLHNSKRYSIMWFIIPNALISSVLWGGVT